MTAFRRLNHRPDLLAVHSADPERWPFLLASTASAGQLGRWSLLLHAADTEPLIAAGPGSPSGGRSGFLEALDAAWRAEARAAPAAPHLPFSGGWFVYLGYELAAEIEPVLDLPPAPGGLPVALARRCPGAVIIDHREQQAWLSAESEPWLERIGAVLEDLPDHPQPDGDAPRLEVTPAPDADFTAGVRRIREYILDGHVFQVNLSRRWTGQSDHPLEPAVLFKRLAGSNAAPFAGLARMPGGTVLSSSPERLVSLRDGLVQTRPIAGTRPRGGSADQDASLSAELIAHPKERAEHIMLIDLERNDLGRVCVTGSVEVDEMMVIESYAHVHHIVSNVRGRMRPDTGPVDAMRAVFPGGTITGCPKVRCMQIIAELESIGRGFYTGAMGYLGLDGSMDLNILIRSMAVAGDRLEFRTGAGIVADSDPDAELAETEDKARGLLRALEPERE